MFTISFSLTFKHQTIKVIIEFSASQESMDRKKNGCMNSLLECVDGKVVASQL
jgi:hypothetical protein